MIGIAVLIVHGHLAKGTIAEDAFKSFATKLVQ